MGGVHTLSEQAVHCCLDDLKLVLDGYVDEVRVHEYPVRRAQRLVVVEEQRRRDLRSECGRFWVRNPLRFTFLLYAK
jgi:hypothetical protein